MRVLEFRQTRVVSSSGVPGCPERCSVGVLRSWQRPCHHWPPHNSTTPDWPALNCWPTALAKHCSTANHCSLTGSSPPIHQLCHQQQCHKSPFSDVSTIQPCGDVYSVISVKVWFGILTMITCLFRPWNSRFQEHGWIHCYGIMDDVIVNFNLFLEPQNTTVHLHQSCKK